MKRDTTNTKKIVAILFGVLLLAALCLFLVRIVPKDKAAHPFGKELVFSQEGRVLYGTPADFVQDKDGAFYVTDSSLHVIWRVTKEESKIVCGTVGVMDKAGRIQGSYKDGAAAEARFDTPVGICSFYDGFLICDSKNHVIRYFNVADGSVSTFAGIGKSGKIDGVLEVAAFSSPLGICTDDGGNVYVSDSGNHCVRRIDRTGYVSTFFGGEQGFSDGAFDVAKLSYPAAIAHENGVFYVADTGNATVRKVEEGEVKTLVWGKGGALSEGALSVASLVSPTDVFVKDGVVYVSDRGALALCKIEGEEMSVLLRAGKDVAHPKSVFALLPTEDVLYFTDADAHVLGELEL